MLTPGVRLPPPKNESVDSGSGHIVSSGKNNGVLTFTLCAMPSGGKRSGSEAIVYCRAVGCSSPPHTAGSQVNNGPCGRKEFLGKGLFGFTTQRGSVKGECKSTTFFHFLLDFEGIAILQPGSQIFSCPRLCWVQYQRNGKSIKGCSIPKGRCIRSSKGSFFLTGIREVLFAAGHGAQQR